MSELFLSGLGVLLLYAAIMPSIALVGKLCLVMHRRRMTEPSDFGSAQMYLLLISLVLGPALWFASAVGHMSESSPSSIVCKLGHVDQDLGRLALILVVLVSGLVGGLVFRRMDQQDVVGLTRVLPHWDSSVVRMRLICSHSTALSVLTDRIDVVAGAKTPICTRGYVKPRVVVSAQWMALLDDAALAGALLHEAEHLKARDPLRYLVASLCLGFNPAAFLLRPELARWRQARELFCDRMAVKAGANPIALAEALLAAARPPGESSHRFAAHLGSGTMSWLQYRIHLLVGYASIPPQGQPSNLAPMATVVAAAFLIIMPHIVDAWPLVGLHHGLEASVGDWFAPTTDHGKP